MNGGNLGLKAILSTVGLIIVGLFAWWLIKVVFGAIFYLLIGALLVGGAWYLYAKAKRTLGGGQRPPRIRRW